LVVSKMFPMRVSLMYVAKLAYTELWIRLSVKRQRKTDSA